VQCINADNERLPERFGRARPGRYAVSGPNFQCGNQSGCGRGRVSRESGYVLPHAVLLNTKVGGLEPGDVVTLPVGHDNGHQNLADIDSEQGRFGRLSSGNANPEQGSYKEKEHRNIVSKIAPGSSCIYSLGLSSSRANENSLRLARQPVLQENGLTMSVHSHVYKEALAIRRNRVLTSQHFLIEE
jgi:hypothetical protein